MDIETITLDEINPSEYNPRYITEQQENALKKNLKKFGLVDPIIINLKNNNTIIGGHQRYYILKEEKPDKKMTLLKLGDIGLVFYDEQLTLKDQNDERALNIALNKITGSWDTNKLEDILVDLENKHYDIQLTGFMDPDKIQNELENINSNNPDHFGTEYSKKEQDSKYISSITTPIYEPTCSKPPEISELYDTTRTDELINEINENTTNLPPEIKKFLKISAYRHVKFNYENIAEYYAHATPGIQQLFENSTLVIIDFHKAIEEGFIKYTQHVKEYLSKED